MSAKVYEIWFHQKTFRIIAFSQIRYIKWLIIECFKSITQSNEVVHNDNSFVYCFPPNSTKLCGPDER